MNDPSPAVWALKFLLAIVMFVGGLVLAEVLTRYIRRKRG